MKAEGFNTVRIPVFWGNMMENDNTYTINKEYLKRVKEIVDYCEKAGVYSVINIHHFDEFIIRRNDLDKCKEIFTHLWTQIAEYFADYPYTLVFEVITNISAAISLIQTVISRRSLKPMLTR